MKPTHLFYVPLLLPALRSSEARAEVESQRYDTSYQAYQEEADRIRVTSYYLRGAIDINADTSFRFQYLRDAISGSSPTGALPVQTELPFLAEIDDIRTGFLAALAHQFGDHRLELEASLSDESDYHSTGLSLNDAWELNRKNTTLSFGINCLLDLVDVPNLRNQPQDKTSLDFFTGSSQIIDKNTVVTANLTLGTNSGYLNDPYKGLQRTEHDFYDEDGDGIDEDHAYLSSLILLFQRSPIVQLLFPEVKVLGTAAAADAVKLTIATVVGLGAVNVGSNASLSFTIKNTGTANLTGLTLTKDGTNAADFTVTANAVAPVSGPGGTTTFTVQFAPSATGAKTAALHLANNDSDESPFDLTLTGTAIAPLVPFEVWMTANGVPPGQTGPQQMPQHDGVPNLLKFAFNLDPTKPDCRLLSMDAGGTAGLPCAACVGGVLRLEFIRRKASTHPGITYTPQCGSDLTGWTVFTATETVTPIGTTDWERVVVNGPVGETRCFGRVQVLQVP
ncbi:MAG: DUF3570 domain-containing protein [Verrucomicrobia bacterium]|nr:DUF3570 domain-containing protein [Verrucomicrobiota bacterium]